MEENLRGPTLRIQINGTCKSLECHAKEFSARGKSFPILLDRSMNQANDQQDSDWERHFSVTK